MSQTFQTQLPTKDNSDNVIKFLKILERDAKDSHVLAEIGVHTQLAKNISDFFSDPLNGMVNSFNSTHKGLVGFLDVVIATPFLKSNKDIINKVYRSKHEGLSYFVILNEDTTENREIFFEFIDNYELLGIDNQIPIKFSFLPSESIKTMPNNLEIALF